MNCTHEPISRLNMELFHLGELPEEKRCAIQQHLESCTACKEAWTFIETDHRPLPPLRLSSTVKRRTGLSLLRNRTVFAFAAAAAIACGILAVFFLPPSSRRPDSETRLLDDIKGGDTALFIVRDRNGAVDESPEEFKEGDRFKIFVTHLGAAKAKWDLAVFQGDEVYFPLTPKGPLEPGARLPLPGALALDGDEPAELCIFIGKAVPSRDRLRTEKRALIPEAAACRSLRPFSSEKTTVDKNPRP